MIENEYPEVVSAVMEYIIEVKKRDPDAPLFDLISDYCTKKGIDVELVGDAIGSDVYFKSFIEKDCKQHNIIRSDDKNLDEW